MVLVLLLFFCLAFTLPRLCRAVPAPQPRKPTAMDELEAQVAEDPGDFTVEEIMVQLSRRPASLIPPARGTSGSAWPLVINLTSHSYM